jgi:hypothetical protein
MTIDKELAEKIRKMVEARQLYEALYEQIVEHFRDYFDGCYIGEIYIADEPMGEDQGDGYCDQYTGYSMDSGSGTYYFPIEGSTKYVAVTYTF